MRPAITLLFGGVIVTGTLLFSWSAHRRASRFMENPMPAAQPFLASKSVR